MQVIVLMLVFSITILTSCEDLSDNLIIDSNLNQRLDQDTYGQLITALDNDEIVFDNFYLRSAEVVDSVLQVTVSYSGGCQEHSFELIWPEAIILIFPPQFDVILLHDAIMTFVRPLSRKLWSLNLLKMD